MPKNLNIKDLNSLSETERLGILKKLRKRVDFFDRILVYILNKRTQASVQIGKIKISLNQPTYVPERERDIMNKISAHNKGPLSRESLERIYERILDQSRATQKSESPKLNNDNINGGKKKSLVNGLLTKRDYYIIGFVFIFVLGILLYTFFSPNYYKAPEPIKFEVKQGETLRSVINSLYSNGIIPSKRNLRIAAFIFGADRKIKAGRYSIPNGISYVGLLDLLIRGKREMPVLVVIPEGSTLYQMAGILKRNLGVDSTDFLRTCNNKRLLDSLGIDANSLQGYLMPDSYFFYFDTPMKAIIGRLRREFNLFMNDSLMNHVKRMNYSLHEILTIASIVDGESNKTEEFPLIAGVYYNRLRTGMKLQADPTVQYANETKWKRLYNKDLNIDSPYNTYMYYGLPPGPINCPGRKAILAAIYPAGNNYLYFVADGKGGHIFSSNYNSHLKAVAKYRAWVRSQQVLR